VLFGLLDLAGRREDTREILIAAQDTFRTRGYQLFAVEDFNEAEAMIGLCLEINRTILQFAAGVRSCPAFLGCYNEDLGTVCYSNAGHTPGRPNGNHAAGSDRVATRIVFPRPARRFHMRPP